MSGHVHWKKLYNPAYLGAYAFEAGEEKTVTIEGVEAGVEVIGEGGKKERCNVLRFCESEVKPLILRPTNARAIEKLLKTPYVDQWKGRRITLYADPTVRFGREVVGGVRVRSALPVDEAPAACEQCGQLVMASGKFTARQILDGARRQFGRGLCMDCAQAEKKARAGAQTDEGGKA